MAARKSWEEMSKGERIGGMVGLATLGVLIVGIISGVVHAVKADTPPPQPANSIDASPPKTPVISHREIKETEPISFNKVTKNDPNLLKGTTKITTIGKNGVTSKTYDITLTDGKETKRTLLNTKITTEAINEVTTIGIKEPYVAPPPAPEPKPAAQSSCDPNYSGACVPIASDVDCGGGSGNGPAYVYGVVKIIGSDIYDLDRDGDGIGCE